ncbi:unnamed protein product [Lactuca saligna]|uniref:Uncharacterized protein n=1 Tax=Lactuca saligna TaxID=75948 RepID=A0AA35ZLK4_LACSI|nr:unnamed protein product [Lactuca saligna]
MAASLFTFSSTSRRVVPAPNSPPLPIYIKATNVIFNPDIPDVHRGLGLDDFVNFLVSCRLRYAISDVPSEFFPKQVCEFYYTTTVNDENNIISGTIGPGRHSVFITADLLSAALRSWDMSKLEKRKRVPFFFPSTSPLFPLLFLSQPSTPPSPTSPNRTITTLKHHLYTSIRSTTPPPSPDLPSPPTALLMSPLHPGHGASPSTSSLGQVLVFSCSIIRF